MTDGVDADRVSVDDRQLLRRFAEHNSQEAFAALTARYLSLVYSVCRRELADDQMAEDVTQAVFLILARKAPALGRNVVLSGWLFQTARFAAKNARLQAQRRAAYEQKAAEAMQQSGEGEDAAWTEIEPLLNQSLAALKEGERQCVLLRFFQGMSFAEAGAALDLSEEAVRKRVGRSLEKMRKSFEKGGVIVPGAALAVLLSAHAAKAVPATCQASIVTATAGALAGHLSLSLAGSHVYQLSEGALKAMKIAQFKVAVNVTTGLVIGLGIFAVAAGKPLSLMTAPHVRSAAKMGTAAKPGHVLVQAPGKAMTPAQIADRCRNAYAALKSYEGTSTVTAATINGSDPAIHEYHASASIRFVRPGDIRAEGTDASGHSFAYVSDGARTSYQAVAGGWQPAKNAETAVASVTGIALRAATTIPSVLLGMRWGDPFVGGTKYAQEVREDRVKGRLCYVLTTQAAISQLPTTRSLWIDEKTFLLCRSVSDSSGVLQLPAHAGQGPSSVAMKSHEEEQFTDERLNETIPDSTFTVPAAQ